jgi:hypothetical protein
MNKNKEKNRQKRIRITLFAPWLKAGRPFSDRGKASNSRTGDHTHNRHWTALFGSGFAAIVG